jgi:F-type H+-transporting ATPase subunit epsilon
MSQFMLNVTACDRVFFQGPCKQLIIPIFDGRKGIQAHHQNMMFMMTNGEIEIQKPDDTWLVGVVGEGLAQVINNRVTILTLTAELPEEIDVRRANEALERAQEQLRQKNSIREYYHSQASLARAMVRLRYGGHDLKV